MYFNESKQLAAKHPNLQNDLQQLDEFLSSQSSTAILIPSVLASILDDQEVRISNILMLYVDSKLLHSEKVYQCPHCDVYIKALSRSRAAEIKELCIECTGCTEPLPPKCKKILIFSFTENAKVALAISPNNLIHRQRNFNRKTTTFGVRNLIETVLKTAEDLDAFIMDNFPKVYREFSSAMERKRKVNLLFENNNSDEVMAALNRQINSKTVPEQDSQVNVS